MVRFGTFIFQNGQNGSLESALCGLEQGWVDCGVLKETKITDRVHTQESSGFYVMTTAAPSACHGGVTVFYRKAEHFTIEEFCLHGPNVISFQLVTWRQQ